eukprot:5054461-Amphidinium_carterae.1
MLSTTHMKRPQHHQSCGKRSCIFGDLVPAGVRAVRSGEDTLRRPAEGRGDMLHDSRVEWALKLPAKFFVLALLISEADMTRVLPTSSTTSKSGRNSIEP